MRGFYALSLSITLIGALVYVYISQPVICDTPLHYSIGTFDVRFNITKTEALTALTTAETAWEKSAGRELFQYDENAPFQVHFIFDDRQERTIIEEAERKALDRKEATSAEIATEYAALRTEYATLETKYKTQTAAYEKKLTVFNDKVEKNNQAGGAPPEVFAELQREEKKLQNEADALQELSNQLTTIAASINDLSEQGNQVIAQYNAGVNSYNREFGEPNEFTQGDFQGDKINIYKFSSTLELEKVLVHELGHALGLGHVEGSSSMMYYLMADQPDSLAVSAQDMTAFRIQCENQSGLVQWYVRTIRSLITTFS